MTTTPAAITSTAADEEDGDLFVTPQSSFVAVCCRPSVVYSDEHLCAAPMWGEV